MAKLKKAKITIPDFLWGCEFETRLLFTGKFKNKQPIISHGKRIITSELVDINRYIHAGKIEECPSDHKDCLFNLEVQYGVYTGDTQEFSQDYENFKNMITSAISERKIKIDKKEYDIFTFVDNSNQRCKNLFKTSPYSEDPEEGCYRSLKYEDKWTGYTETLEADLTGIPQLTCTFKLKFLPNLFKNLSIHINKSPIDFMFFYVYQMSYNIALKLVKDTYKDADYLTTFGFMIYLVYYCLVLTQANAPKAYLKAWFPIKPRTNIGILYSKLSVKCQENIINIYHSMKPLKDNIPAYFYPEFILQILKSLLTPDAEPSVYYIKGLADVPPNFYTLDKSIKTEDLLAQGASVTLVPFYYCHPKPDGSGCKKPDIKYPESYVEIWEWMTDDDSISIEFRNFEELARVCLRVIYIYDRESDDYNFLSKSIYDDRFLLSNLERAIKLIFDNFFRNVFTDTTIKEHSSYLEYVEERTFNIQIDGVKFTERDYKHQFHDENKKTYRELLVFIKGLEEKIDLFM